jgi:hypothetical protein
VRLVVRRHGSASIRLLTANGQPYAGSGDITVEQVTSTVSGEDWQEVTDGIFRVHGLLDGEARVVLRIGGFAPVSRRFEARMGRHLDLGEERLHPGIDLVGTVRDSAGLPIRGAEVSTEFTPAETTDSRGRFSIPHLRGTVRLHVEAGGFAPTDLHVDPARGPVEIRLARGAVVFGTVTDDSGAAVPTPHVSVRRLTPDGAPVPGADPVSGDGAPDGGFRVRLAAGRHRFEVRQADGTFVLGGEATLTEGETHELILRVPRR